MESPETPSDADLEKLRREVYDHPTELWRRFDFGLALYKRGNYSEAIHELQKAQLWPNTRWEAMRLLADTYDAKGMPKLAARVRYLLSQESGEDSGEGSAPVPAPKRPITPRGSFRGERRPEEDDRAA